jgi:peptidoglycan/xylan/chitin deacetylase (PgdA/CDA1 family)
LANDLLVSFANSSIANSLIGLVERFDISTEHMLRVLTYHRVADPADTPSLYPRVTVHPKIFAQHMRFLSQRYRVVSMEDVLQAARGGYLPGSLPKRAVLITFDDAYTDFAEYALPILKRFRLPVTVFVPTAFPGLRRAFWWDRLYAAVECAHDLGTIQTTLGPMPVHTPAERKTAFTLLRDYVKFMPHAAAMQWVDRFCADLEAPELGSSVLSWDELRAVASDGVNLCPHTRNHPMMDQISNEVARAEAAGSWQDLRAEIGDSLPVFAYPSGGYNREVQAMLKEEGFEIAFTTQRGLNDLQRADPLQMKRINVGPNTSLPLLRAQLLGWMKYLAG